jgi:hypothetical protein
MKFGNFSGMNNSLCGGLSGQSSVYAPVAGKLWTPSTWSLKGGITTTGTFGGGVSETLPSSLWWNATGNQIFFSGTNSNQLKVYTGGSGYDLNSFLSGSSGTSLALKAVDGITNVAPTAIALSADGLNLFSLSGTQGKLFKHTLGTAFTASTVVATAAQENALNFAFSTGPNGISFIETGGACKLLIINGGANRTIQVYSMNAAFDLTTLVQTQTQSAPTSTPYGCCWMDNGLKFAIVDHAGGNVRCYTTAAAYTIATVTSSSHYDTIDLRVFGFTNSTFTDIQFNSAGTRMYLTDHTGDRMIQFGMT